MNAKRYSSRITQNQPDGIDLRKIPCFFIAFQNQDINFEFPIGDNQGIKLGNILENEVEIAKHPKIKNP